MTEKRYDINGTTYVQRPLVLGQLGQLIAVLKDVSFAGNDILNIVAGIGDRLPIAIAIVLVPDGVALKDKNFQSATDDAMMLDLEASIRIVNDFFECNPVQSLLHNLNGVAQAMSESRTNGLATSSVSSPEGT